jgi:hypothetical protein
VPASAEAATIARNTPGSTRTTASTQRPFPSISTLTLARP